MKHIIFRYQILGCLILISLSNWTIALAEEANQYRAVKGPCNLTFPEDHRPHPGYRTEWWYYTGNLSSNNGDAYGFQLTFFRSQISPSRTKRSWPDPHSKWRTLQIYIAHGAVSDLSKGRHFQTEQVAREAFDIAGASVRGQETTIFLKNWSARIGVKSHQLKLHSNEFSFELDLTPLKPPVLHGLNGYSLKGSTPERASCYYSFTRLNTTGQLTISGRMVQVTGLAWMDHECSTAPLDPDIIGWDWFSLQLSDETEIMVFFLRKKQGGFHDASSGTLVHASGITRHLAIEDFGLEILDTWSSRESGGIYPSGWRLQIPGASIDLIISPNLSDQEMRTSNSTGVHYWEGSVSVRGTKKDLSISGKGYVELTGYAGEFGGPM